MKLHYEIGCGFLEGDVDDSEVVPWLCGKGGYICQGVGNSTENANAAVKHSLSSSQHFPLEKH